jgi:uncharacterized protein YqhQ
MPKVTVGGQAVLEGLMIRSTKKMAVAVRRSDGSISLYERLLSQKEVFPAVGGVPLIRGIIVLVSAFRIGYHALDYSFLAAQEDCAGCFQDHKKLRENKTEFLPGLSSFMVVGVCTLALGFIFLMPCIILDTLDPNIEHGLIIQHLMESAIRLLLIISYVYGLSFVSEIYRVYQYHGAEHKVIHAYEKGYDLCVDTVRECNRYHVRCGSMFLVYTAILAVIAYSLLPANLSIIQQLSARFILLPVIAGISFELFRNLDRIPSGIAKFVLIPGMLFQSLTTREPTDDQLEIGISALKASIGEPDIAI